MIMINRLPKEMRVPGVVIRVVIIAATILSLVTAGATAQKPSAPILFILGEAQDAGYPQAGCYKPHCMPGWQGSKERKLATSLGLVDKPAGKKILFEATPDFPEQLFKLDALSADENSPLDAIFLTHAHIGHYTGLMHLGHEVMGTKNIPVFTMPRMTKFLKENGPWSQLVKYQNITLKNLQADHSVRVGSVGITPFLVPHRDEYSETVGYRIEGPDKTAIFIPDINKWSVWDQDLIEMLATVDYAFLDATFFAQGELPGRDMSKVPHPLVMDTMEKLQDLTQSEKAKVWFIHMNHTNPMLDPNSDESKKVRDRGFNIARAGMKFSL